MIVNSFDRIRELEYGFKVNHRNYQKVNSRIIETLECANSQTFHLPCYIGDMAPPFSCDFSNQHPDYLLVSKEDGVVHLFDVEEASLATAHITDFEAHMNAIFDVKWSYDDSKFLTASGDQSIRLYDVHTKNLLQEYIGHTMSVKYLSFTPTSDEVFASASRDGSIRIWDRRVNTLTGSNSSIILLSNCHTNYFMNSEQYKRSRLSIQRKKKNNNSRESQGVTCVKFLSDHIFISSGSTDCSLKLWDTRFLGQSSKQKIVPLKTYTYKGLSQRFLGFSDICLNDSKTRMFALCNDSTIYEYDMLSMSTRPVFLYSGHTSNSFYIKMDISYDSNYLVCGSDSGSAVVYTVGSQEQNPLILPARNVTEVSVAKWSKNCPTRLVTLYDNAQASIWNCHPARHYEPVVDHDQLYGMAYRSGTISRQIDLMKNLLVSPPPQPSHLSTPSRSMAEISGQPRSNVSSPNCSSSGDACAMTITPKREKSFTSFNQAIHTPPPNHVVSPLSRVNRQLNIREFVVASPKGSTSSSPLSQTSKMNNNSRALIDKSSRKTLVTKRPRMNSSVLNLLINNNNTNCNNNFFEDPSQSNKENISPHTFSKMIHNSDTDTEPSTPKGQATSNLLFHDHSSDSPGTPRRTLGNSRKRLSIIPTSIPEEVEPSSSSRPRKRRKTLFPARNETRKRRNNNNQREEPSLSSSTLVEARKSTPGIESYFL